MPETPDALFAEADKRLAAAAVADARRLFEAFVNRYPQRRARGASAQYNIGEAYAGEKRYANAIGAYTKVVDNFPKSDVVPDAMYKNGAGVLRAQVLRRRQGLLPGAAQALSEDRAGRRTRTRS